MGGQEKDSRSSNLCCTVPSKPGRQKEDVSEAEICKLLKHFTSAELFPQSCDPSQAEGGGSKGDGIWQEVVTSFKHLHVRRPEHMKRCRLKKHTRPSRRSANMLNLAIAAGNFQKPIVWPARLQCSDCKKSNASILCPPRLRIHSGSDGEKVKSLTVPCSSCKLKSGKEHVTRGENPMSTFGEALGASNMSFSDLCQHQVASPGARECASPRVGTSTKGVHQTSPFAGHQLFTNNPLRPSPSQLLSSEGSLHPSLVSTNTTASAVYAPRPLTLPSSAAPSSVRHTSASSHPGAGRTCSQEMRDMEDTNVNELASYLEDLLHIPRKMSSMAEMMYA